MVVEKAAKKPKVNVRGLAAEWDDAGPVRQYLRENPDQPLFHETIKVCVKDAAVPHINAILKAILLRSCGLPKQPQPQVRALREQLTLVYKNSSRTPSEDNIVTDSWFIRKFLVMIKNKANKHLVSTAPHLHQLKSHISIS